MSLFNYCHVVRVLAPLSSPEAKRWNLILAAALQNCQQHKNPKVRLFYDTEDNPEKTKTDEICCCHAHQ